MLRIYKIAIKECHGRVPFLELVEEVRRAWLGYGAEVVDKVGLGHAHARVRDVKDVALLVRLNPGLAIKNPPKKSTQKIHPKNPTQKNPKKKTKYDFFRFF